MRRGETLAYLAGIVDGDGYFKVSRAFRTRGTVHPYYATVVGVQQLWPGPAVRLFASSFGGVLMDPQRTIGGRLMARCEVQGRKAESAARRLLPFLLLKRAQALLLLEVARLRPHKRGRAPRMAVVYDEMETRRRVLSSLHGGSLDPRIPLAVASCLNGYDGLSPDELGWSRGQLFAYLAGVIDSDGNLRVERRRVLGMLGPQYRINIRCKQVWPSQPVQLLSETFGGRISIRKSMRPNHRDLMTWSLHDKTAAPAVEALLPYLRVKWPEAVLLLELRGLKARGRQGMTEWEHPNRWRASVRMRKRCYTTDQVAQFERIHRAVQALHSGGVPDAGSRGGPTQLESRLISYARLAEPEQDGRKPCDDVGEEGGCR